MYTEIKIFVTQIKYTNFVQRSIQTSAAGEYFSSFTEERSNVPAKINTDCEVIRWQTVCVEFWQYISTENISILLLPLLIFLQNYVNLRRKTMPLLRHPVADLSPRSPGFSSDHSVRDLWCKRRIMTGFLLVRQFSPLSIITPIHYRCYVKQSTDNLVKP